MIMANLTRSLFGSVRYTNAHRGRITAFDKTQRSHYFFLMAKFFHAEQRLSPVKGGSHNNEKKQQINEYTNNENKERAKKWRQERLNSVPAKRG